MNINSVNLSEVTTYRFGGFCKNFINIKSEDELSDLKNIIKGKQNVILGKGSNIAFSDKDFNGNVLTPKFEELTLSDNFEIKVGSSVFLPKLSRFFKDNSLSNGEFLIGIPGTVGGAIKMNAGAYGWEFSELLKDLRCFNLETFEIEILKKEELEFSYRKSKNLDNKIILSATLTVEKGDKRIINKNLSEFNEKRKKSQPAAIYNAGSVFKNTSDYYAGELIDNAGLKGYEIDGVRVSEKHANFFVAEKGAKAMSLFNLVQYVKDKVSTKFGITLEEEIIFIGDFTK
ncbi:UDP-N-acetylmuramate dehydrogenase [Acidimicrobiaceae bacterium]|nr:UDP-N-acetylmuramate dehydrogenase [Acidimicrobiaceae bacterium]